MAEYIEREALIEEIKERNRNTCNGSMSCLQMKRMVEKVPAADVAPVVRCRECKHFRNSPNGMCTLHTEPCENAAGYKGEAVCVEEDDFCSYGEMKGNE